MGKTSNSPRHTLTTTLILFFPLAALSLFTGCSKDHLPQKNQLKSISGSIFGGKRALKDQFSSTVMLRIDDDEGISKCSGALVDHRTVLTAAHCLKNSNLIDKQKGFDYYKKRLDRITVIVGTGAIGEENHYYKVSYFAIHPEYQLKGLSKTSAPASSRMDYAFLELEKAVPEDLVKIIPPITGEELRKYIARGTPITAVGFGKTEDGTMGFKKELPGMELENSGGSIKFGGQDKGVCTGDSGGPSFVFPSPLLRLSGPRLLAINSYINGICGDSESDYYAVGHTANHGMDFIRADRLRRQGNIQLSNSNYRGAFSSYQKALDLVPVDDELTLHFWKTVMKHAGNSLELVKDAEARRATALMYKNSFDGKVQEAINQYMNSSEYDKANESARHKTLADFYTRLEDAEKAFYHIENFVKLDQSETGTVYPDSYSQYSIVALVQQRPDIAKTIAERILNGNPHHSEALVQLAVVAMKNQQFELANRYLNLAFEHNPSLLGSRAFEFKLSVMLKLGTGDEEKKELILERKKVVEEILMANLKIYDHYLAYDASFQKDLMDIRSDYPENAMSYYYESRYLLSRFGADSIRMALSVLAKGLAINPDHPDLLNQRGELLARSDSTIDEAISSFRKAVSIKPDHPKAARNLSKLLFERGDWEEAIEVISYKILISPNLNDYRLRGNYYYVRAKYDYEYYAKALEDIDRYLEIDPQNQFVYFRKGVLNRRLGNNQDALEIFYVLRSLPNVDPAISQAIEREMGRKH